jgi:hypothetical protein
MPKRLIGRTLILLIIFAVVVAGVMFTVVNDGDPSATAHAQEVHMASDDRLLAWVAPGAAPGQHGASQPGQIVFLDGEGNEEPVFDVPTQTARVHACGNEATSPDGRTFAFYVGGNDLGNLVMMRDADPNTTVLTTDLSVLTCTGNGTYQYSPDSTSFGYIAYPSDFGVVNSPSGRLFLHNSEDFSLLNSFDNVSAFDMSDEATAMVSFFYNNQSQATEVAVINFDGEIDREVATLFADEGCYYTSASVDIMPDGKFASVLGYRCTAGDGRTQWQFYVIDPANFNATLIASDVAGGGFFGGSRTNNVFGAPNGTTIFFTIPDGITNFTTGVKVVDVATSNQRDVFPNSGVMPRASFVPYLGENHPTVTSPDGNFLAIVRNDPNNRAGLTVLDLAQYDLPPIEITMPERGDLIGEMLFTTDNQRLIYTAGGAEGVSNSLFALDLLTGSERRIRRGNYGQGVLSPDGRYIAISNWEILNDDEPPIYTLVTLDLETTAELPLFIGADVIEGEVVNQRFAYPLSWRQAR